MNYRIQIHKRYAYVKPTPKKDIKEGLVMLLNNPSEKGETHFIATDILEGVKEYRLPDLQPGDYIKSIFIKDDKKN